MFQPFLCSPMATLPQGLVEIPSFNCTLNYAEKVIMFAGHVCINCIHERNY